MSCTRPKWFRWFKSFWTYKRRWHKDHKNMAQSPSKFGCYIVMSKPWGRLYLLRRSELQPKIQEWKICKNIPPFTKIFNLFKEMFGLSEGLSICTANGKPNPFWIRIFTHCVVNVITSDFYKHLICPKISCENKSM